jgi:hypothetical protein
MGILLYVSQINQYTFLAVISSEKRLKIKFYASQHIYRGRKSRVRPVPCVDLLSDNCRDLARLVAAACM